MLFMLPAPLQRNDKKLRSSHQGLEEYNANEPKQGKPEFWHMRNIIRVISYECCM